MNQVPEIKEGLQFTVPDEPQSGVNTVVGIGNLYVSVEDEDSIRPTKTEFTKEEVIHCFKQGVWLVHPPFTSTIPLSTLFSSQPHNVVMTALEECAKDFWKDGTYPDGFDGPVNSFIEWNTDPEALTKLIVDNIHQLGFTIIPK